jgi:hypothetical protein
MAALKMDVMRYPACYARMLPVHGGFIKGRQRNPE